MVLVVLFFVLSFMAIGGTYLNINPYDNLIWIKTIAHFIFLAFTMMIIPFCYKKFSPKANVKNGRRICKWNCLIVLSFYFVIDIFLMSGIYDETFQNLGANLVYTLMFYYINCKLFFNKNKVTEETIPCDRKKEHIENTQNTLDLDIDKMTPQEAAEYLVAEQLGEKYTPKEKQDKKVKIKYCSQCGSQIDPVTKKCTGCGKQYFKGIKITKFTCITTIVAVFLIISVVFNIFQNIKNQELNTEIDNLIESVDDLENDIWQYKTNANFVDEYVVFVEDDGTNLYHKIDCYRFKRESFWIYNVPTAENYDYSPCPLCH